MVKYAPGMNFFELLEAITEKRKALGRVGALQAIHTQNSGDKQYECKVGCEVPVPLANEVGSSDDMPYFFSIVQTETGNLLVVSWLYVEIPDRVIHLCNRWLQF